MRYIGKNLIEHIGGNATLVPLTDYITAQLGALPDPLHPAYKGLNNVIKPALEAQLMSEQNGLCCYCMEKLETGKYHIEHLLPQSAFKNEEVQYYNLFLSCGSPKEVKRHCGHPKGDLPIPKLISFHNPKAGTKCEDYFKYNLQGEILPKTGFISMEANYNRYRDLNPFNRQLLGVIEILNLNCDLLKERRKSIAETIMLLPDNRANLNITLTSYRTQDAQGNFDPLYQVAIFFLDEKIKRIR